MCKTRSNFNKLLNICLQNEVEFARSLKSADFSPPSIFILRKQESEEIVIRNFGQIVTGIQGFHQALFLGLGLYYVFDIPFPKILENVLRLLECLVFGIDPILPRKVMQAFNLLTK